MEEEIIGSTMKSEVSFDFVEETEVRSVLEEYYEHARKALAVKAYLGAVVGCGAVAEGVLTWALKRNEPPANTAQKARKHKKKPIEEWPLKVLIDVARELDLLTDEAEQICHTIRDYRNLVHPYRRVQGSPRFDEALALSGFRAVARIVQAVGGTASPPDFSPAEMQFSWVTEGHVAGCRGPKTADDLRFLKKEGIRALVRLVEADNARVTKQQVCKIGIEDCHEEVQDFHPPEPGQLERILDFIDRMLSENKPVAVSCGAGYGRTGTVLACYLIKQGKSSSEALDYLAQVRPVSAQEILTTRNSGQYQAIIEFERRLRPRLFST